MNALVKFIKKHLIKYNIIKTLSDKGERVDISYKKNINENDLDIYQKSHLRRYLFARQHIRQGGITGDFACGTGYGSLILSEHSARVTGIDINKKTIDAIKKRYASSNKVEFLNKNLLSIEYENIFDSIVSFETLEHIAEEQLPLYFNKIAKALKLNGVFIFSTPYMQEKSENALKYGFHLTFYIDETKIDGWLKNAGLKTEEFYYQDYKTHVIVKEKNNPDFVIGIARKRSI